MSSIEVYDTWGTFYESLRPMIVGKWKGRGYGFTGGPEGYSYLIWNYDVLRRHNNALELKRDDDGIHFTIGGRNILVKDGRYSIYNPKHNFFVVYGPQEDQESKHVIVALFSHSSLLWDISEDAPSDSPSVTAPVFLFHRPETTKWEELALSRLTIKVREMAGQQQP